MPSSSPTPSRRSRQLLALGAALVVAGATAIATPAVVGAGTGTGTGTGGAGQSVTVTPVDDLDPAGETVTVTGTGFDAGAGFDAATEGLYVALCVDNGPGQQPTPCIGGVDVDGETGASRWITNNPIGSAPSVPISADGSFSTTVELASSDEFTDCAALPAGKECKVFVRMDHRASGDRTQDVRVPVTWGEGQPAGPATTVAPTTGLDPDGSDVTVTGTGFPTTGPGVAVVFGPAPGGSTDTARHGARVVVPAAEIASDGSFSVTLPDVTAAYTGTDGKAYDFADGGGFVSTVRAGGAADPEREWETSVPVAFAGAAVPATTTSLIIAPTTVAAGVPVVATATVQTDGASASSDGTRTHPRAAVTDGTVELFDGTTSLGTATLGPDGRATRTATFSTPGPHSVTARFTGSAAGAASTSTPVVVTVTAPVDPDPDPDPDPGPDPSDQTPSGTATGRGVKGQTLTATPVDNLDPAGTEVEITGTGFTEAAGFDIEAEGLYVSFCVDNGAGAQPSPCVGGVDTEGASGASKWVTNNPYEGVPASAVSPVAADGSFTATITVAARDEFVDCLALSGGKRCVIVSRMDHRATADRSQDVKVPVCFAGEAACAIDPIDPTAGPAGGQPPFGGYPLPAPARPTPLATPGGLASTGFAGRSLVPTGLVLVGLGAALVLVARRRPAATAAP